MIWDILEEDEYKQRIEELKKECIKARRVGYAESKNGFIIPCIGINKPLYQKLVKAGSIDNKSCITAFNLPPYLYVKLEIWWPSIKEKLFVILNGWRDRTWLELLCCLKMVALTPQDLEVSKPIFGSIIVDGVNVDKLRLVLAVTSLFHPPKDFPQSYRSR